MSRRVVLFGGTSDIGLAIVARLAADEPTEVVLAARAASPNLDAAVARAEASGATSVSVVDFDALDFASHPAVVEQVFATPVAIAVVAFGLLGDPEQAWRDQAAAVRLAQTNTTGAISIGVALTSAFERQGSGRIVAISSVAAEKVRRSNFVYGATKAAMDGFYTQLGEALRGSGVGVLVVRPGFVTTKLTVGRGRVALAVTPEQVADATAEALVRGRTMIRVPWVFGPITWVFKHLPAGLVRRLRF